MNYRHIFHAGNFADVFKHIILISLLRALSQKGTPFFYLDTHAGAGIYDLSLLSTISKKETKEYETGIELLMKFINIDGYEDNIDKREDKYKCDKDSYKFDFELHPIIKYYVEVVKSVGYPNFYPGSPLIAQNIVKDRMILLEMHPEEYKTLKHLFRNNPNISIHLQDGYLGIKAFLPPKERRGLIFIDPPFEKQDEWQRIIESIDIGLKRFQNGVYAIWYPIKDKQTVSHFKNNLKNEIKRVFKRSNKKLDASINENMRNENEKNGGILTDDQFLAEKLLEVEFIVYPEDTEFTLIGCGMIIINPPWQIEQTINECLDQLLKISNCSYKKVE